MIVTLTYQVKQSKQQLQKLNTWRETDEIGVELETGNVLKETTVRRNHVLMNMSLMTAEQHGGVMKKYLQNLAQEGLQID